MYVLRDWLSLSRVDGSVAQVRVVLDVESQGFSWTCSVMQKEGRRVLDDEQSRIVDGGENKVVVGKRDKFRDDEEEEELVANIIVFSTHKICGKVWARSAGRSDRKAMRARRDRRAAKREWNLKEERAVRRETRENTAWLCVLYLYDQRLAQQLGL